MASRSHTTAAAAQPAVCSLLDLGATFTETAGAEFTAPAVGQRLRPILRGWCPPASADGTASELADEDNVGAASR